MDKLIFINNTGTDYCIYYDKRNKRVWYLDLDGKDTEGKRHRFANFYEFPYRESVKKLVRREFHNSLTDAQKNLIPNYDTNPQDGETLLMQVLMLNTEKLKMRF